MIGIYMIQLTVMVDCNVTRDPWVLLLLVQLACESFRFSTAFEANPWRGPKWVTYYSSPVSLRNTNHENSKEKSDKAHISFYVKDRYLFPELNNILIRATVACCGILIVIISMTKIHDFKILIGTWSIKHLAYLLSGSTMSKWSDERFLNPTVINWII